MLLHSALTCFSNSLCKQAGLQHAVLDNALRIIASAGPCVVKSQALGAIAHLSVWDTKQVW